MNADNCYISNWENNLSLYIPCMNRYVTEERIIHIFRSLLLGDVHHVDYIYKQHEKGYLYFAVYIHFNEWYDTIASRNFQAKVHDPFGTRLVYDDPCYWLIFANKTQKQDTRKRKHTAMFDMSELEQDNHENEMSELITEIDKQRNTLDEDKHQQQQQEQLEEGEVREPPVRYNMYNTYVMEGGMTEAEWEMTYQRHVELGNNYNGWY